MQRVVRHARVDTDDSQHVMQQSIQHLSRQVRYSSEGDTGEAEHIAMRMSHGEGAGDSSQDHRRFSVTDEAPSTRAEPEHDDHQAAVPAGCSRYSVLVAKVLTNSDAVSGRVILPRIAVEANLPFISGYRSYMLTVRDRDGHKWEFAIKSWANGNENRRVYVLEQALEYLRAYNLGAGAALGICTSEDGTLVVEANTPAVKAATVRPVYGVLAPEHTPPPMPGKATPLLSGGCEPGKCNRNPNCTKPAGHPGFCSGPRPKTHDGEAGMSEEEEDAGADGDELGDAVVAKVLTEYDVTHGRLVLPHGQVESAFPQARSQPYFLLKVCDMRLRQWELHVRSYHNAGRSMMYVVEDAADMLLANSLQQDDCIALFSRGGRLMLEVNTEDATRAARRARDHGTAAASGRTQAAPAPSYALQGGDMLVCTRTHGCTKCAGHQGFCSGHKGFKRRERSGATGSTATSDDERGASRAFSTGTKHRRRTTTGSDVDCEEHEAGPSSSRDEYSDSAEAGSGDEGGDRDQPRRQTWQLNGPRPPRLQLPPTPPRNALPGSVPELAAQGRIAMAAGLGPSVQLEVAMAQRRPIAPQSTHYQQQGGVQAADAAPAQRQPPPALAAVKVEPSSITLVPPPVITLPKKMPPEINVKCGSMRGLFMVAQGLVTGTMGTLKGRMMSMSEFERHGGKGHVKKWRDSLFVDEPGNQHDNMTLGAWLKHYGINTLPKAKVRPGSVKAAVAAAAQQDARVRAQGVAGGHDDEEERGKEASWRLANSSVPGHHGMPLQGLPGGLPPLPSVGRLPVPALNSPARPDAARLARQLPQTGRTRHSGQQWGGPAGPGRRSAADMPPPPGHGQQSQQQPQQQPRHDPAPHRQHPLPQRQLPPAMLQWPPQPPAAAGNGPLPPAAFQDVHRQQPPPAQAMPQHQPAPSQAMQQQQQRPSEVYPPEQQGGAWHAQLGRVETEAAGVLLSLLQSGGESEAASIRETPQQEAESLRRQRSGDPEKASGRVAKKAPRGSRKRPPPEGTSEGTTETPQAPEHDAAASPSIGNAKRMAGPGHRHGPAAEHAPMLPPPRALSVTSVALEGWGSGLSSLLASSEFAGLPDGQADAETLGKEPSNMSMLHAVFDQMGGNSRQVCGLPSAVPDAPASFPGAPMRNGYHGTDGREAMRQPGAAQHWPTSSQQGDSAMQHGDYYPSDTQDQGRQHRSSSAGAQGGRYDGAMEQPPRQRAQAAAPAPGSLRGMDSATIESLVGMLAPHQRDGGADAAVTMRDIEDKVFRTLVSVCAQKFRSPDMAQLLAGLVSVLPPTDAMDDAEPHNLEASPAYLALRQRYGNSPSKSTGTAGPRDGGPAPRAVHQNGVAPGQGLPPLPTAFPSQSQGAAAPPQAHGDTGYRTGPAAQEQYNNAAAAQRSSTPPPGQYHEAAAQRAHPPPTARASEQAAQCGDQMARRGSAAAPTRRDEPAVQCSSGSPALQYSDQSGQRGGPTAADEDMEQAVLPSRAAAAGQYSSLLTQLSMAPSAGDQWEGSHPLSAPGELGPVQPLHVPSMA